MLLASLAFVASCSAGSTHADRDGQIDDSTVQDTADDGAGAEDSGDDAPAPDDAIEVTPPRDTESDDDGPAADVADEVADDVPTDASPDTAPTRPPFADTDFCQESRAFVPQFAETIARFATQDDLDPPPAGRLLLVGSSSVRRWERFALDFADLAPLQRGIGGVQLGEVARAADGLVLRHRPSAVAVFAGTNDVAAGVDASTVVERFRCLRQQIGAELGWDVPVIYIAITPTPARWATWDVADAVNRAIDALRAEDPALHVADVATPFLELGTPPPSSLFVADQLHLNEEGYARWSAIVRAAVHAAGVAPPAPRASDVRAGDVIRIDLGPDNPEDGERTPSPDYLGHHWNNWHALDGGGAAIAGEHLGPLVTTDGRVTTARLVLAGGFLANGRANGGLLWPDAALLGDLAVGSATGDYFYADEPDRSSSFVLEGLQPGAPYRVGLFAAREDGERRVTRFEAQGADATTLQTSGDGAGAAGARTNDDDVAELLTVADPQGRIFVDVDREEGAYAYLAIVEVEALEP